MDKYAISNSKKIGLPNLVKSPIGAHKAISNSMKMLTNLLSQVGNIKRDGKKTHTCLYLEKRREDDVGKKNKAVTTSLAFPFP